ncbi:uncharacterized protein LOC124302449 isoform X1 [Neodiprion virginianus]|uniref:uncharacterized protein LOC124302449 isoform X1 n=2 Tax=Neodiprion virginianus TaxID=2961670 RepID=UPI001EE73DA6|nr:uncharacterized protein LOC124302449 isoform X1 [Neodiprion virginianus]
MRTEMLLTFWVGYILALHVSTAAVGEAYDISPTSTYHLSNHPSWSGSALEIRSVSGVGHFAASVNPHETIDHRRNRRGLEEFETDPEKYIEDLSFEDFPRSRREMKDVEEFTRFEGLMKKPRVRRDAEPNLEKVSSSKSVREARLNSPETWSKQPISIELRRHSNADQTPFGKDIHGSSGHHVPKTDFVTGHRRDFSESRESRAMPELARSYQDYVPLFREKVRQRDFDVTIPRYYYPDRFGSDRSIDERRPASSTHYYNRYNEEDVSPYGRAHIQSKPKRIVYYAHLPEVARKPVDIRNNRHLYDDVVRSPPEAVASSTSYSRAPGHVDNNNYRYRMSYPYEAYRPYQRYAYRRPYDALYRSEMNDDQYMDHASLREELRYPELEGGSLDRKVYSRVFDRSESTLPWPVEIGTKLHIKDDKRIPGRRIFGQNNDDNGYEVNAKIQAALNSDNPNTERRESSK